MRHANDLATLLDRPIDSPLGLDVDYSAANNSEKLKFQKIEKSDPNRMQKLAGQPFRQICEEDKFFYRMHLHVKVPFFEKYDALTMVNICKCMNQSVYEKDQVLAAHG